MRIVHIPAPQPAPRVWLEAPAGSTRARSFIDARDHLQRVLTDVAGRTHPEEGCFTRWWGAISPHPTRADAAVAWLWLNDEGDGRRALAELREDLSDASRTKLDPPHVAEHSSPVDKNYAAPLLLTYGEEPIGTLHYPELDYRIDPDLDPARESVRPQVELHYARCRCPACGERVHPVEVIRGYPTREVSVLAAIGEVVLGGCVFGDEPNHPDCPQCRASIPGRRL